MDATEAAPGLLRRGAAYAFFLGVSVAIPYYGHDLRSMDFHAPFNYGGDAQLILPFIKGTVENGTHWRIERLGAPGVCETYDFPVIDHLHLAILRLLSWVWPDTIVVYNVYYYLTYPLTLFTAMLTLRRFGLSFAAAGVGGLLYAFLPYHYLREGHYFLTAYYVAPLTLTIALGLCRGRLPFFRLEADGRYRLALWSRDALEATLVAIATVSAGAYYGFFGCAFLAAATLYGWAAHRNWRVAVSGGLVTAIAAAAGFANHAPTILYQRENGRNSAPHTRHAFESEMHGFKLTQLVLPVILHRVPAVNQLRQSYDDPWRAYEFENRTTTLGLVGTTGLVIVFAALFFPGRRAWPIGPLAALTLVGFLLGTMGGVGSLIGFLINPQIRSCNRVIVYVAFLVLFAVVWAVDRGFDLAPRAWLRWFRWPVLLAVAAGGLYDQLNIMWFTPWTPEIRERTRKHFYQEAEFYGRVEQTVPHGMVFMLPFVEYPEASPKVNGVLQHDPAAAYIHTKTVRWSYGAMKGREIDQWQREVVLAPTPEMLRRVVFRGFDALVLDRRGYKPETGTALLAAIAAEVGPSATRFEDETGTHVFVDLRGFRDKVRAELGDRYEAEARRDAEAVRALWLHGFYLDGVYGPGLEWKLRWVCPKAEIVFVNPTDRPRTMQLSMRFLSDLDEPFDLKIDGGSLLSGVYTMKKGAPAVTPAIVVPPGRHTVRLHYRAPRSFKPTDPRWAAVRVADFTMTELPAPPSP